MQTHKDKNKRKNTVLQEENDTIGQWEGALIVLYQNLEFSVGRERKKEVSYLETKADQRFSAFYEILNFRFDSLNRKSTDEGVLFMKAKLFRMVVLKPKKILLGSCSISFAVRSLYKETNCESP